MKLELNNEEAYLVKTLLSKELKETEIEINHASHREYKDFLKEREKQLEVLLGKIS